jgi:hypothetical protein
MRKLSRITDGSPNAKQTKGSQPLNDAKIWAVAYGNTGVKYASACRLEPIIIYIGSKLLYILLLHASRTELYYYLNP